MSIGRACCTEACQFEGRSLASPCVGSNLPSEIVYAGHMIGFVLMTFAFLAILDFAAQLPILILKVAKTFSLETYRQEKAGV